MRRALPIAGEMAFVQAGIDSSTAVTLLQRGSAGWCIENPVGMGRRDAFVG